MSPLRARYRSPFTSEHFDISDPAQQEHDRGLSSYLRSARMTLGHIGGPEPMRVKLGHYPQLSFAQLSTPPMMITWDRDASSRGRTVLVLARTGGFAMESAGPVITRGRTAALAVPGGDPLTITTTEAHTELVYVSAPAEVLPAGIADMRDGVDREPISWRRLAPLYLFIHSLTSAPPQGANDPRALLAEPAHAIAVALASALAGDIAVPDSLYARAQEYLGVNFVNVNTSLASVAVRLSVAPRTLQAAFAENATTFSHELRALRVAEARRVQVEQTGIPAESVARMSGFSSLSAMYRALRAESSPDVGGCAQD